MTTKQKSILDEKSRVERLREIVDMIAHKEQFSAFGLAVKYNISINVVYRDIKTLKSEKLIPKGFKFAPKER